jgi:hypothetical protein
MKTKAIIAIAIIISAALMATRVPTNIDTEQFKEGKYIHVDNMMITFDKTDANVNILYHLSPFAEVYIFLFGSKHMEPKIKEIFFDFENVEIQTIGRDSATIQIKNISRQSEESYLHDSHELGIQPDMLTIVYPDGTRRNYEYAQTTPNIFY